MPTELLEYRLCEKFGWTPKDINEQDSATLNKFLTIMSLDNQLQNSRANSGKKHG